MVLNLSRLGPVQKSIIAAIKAKDAEALSALLAPPRLGVVVTDDLLDTVLLLQTGRNGTAYFDPQICRLLLHSMSENLIQEYTSGNIGGNSINSITRDSPLVAAIANSQVHLFKFLVNDFADIFSIHQLYGNRPLFFYAVGTLERSPQVSREICRFLVEKGADVDQVAANGCTPLYHALLGDSTEAVSFLLDDCSADPNHSMFDARGNKICPLDLAIIRGNPAMVSALLSHGAAVVSALVVLFGTRSAQTTRETKLDVCRVLKAHYDASTTRTTTSTTTTPSTTLADSFKSCLKTLITSNDRESCAILLEAGVNNTAQAMLLAIEMKNQSICQWLVEEYHVDPFVVQEDNHDAASGAVLLTPFQASSHSENVAIFGYFLNLQNERASIRGGQQELALEPESGDVLDIFCRDPLVSFQAIELLVKRHAIRAATTNAQGLYPFQVAAASDAQLDVIFHLLKHAPDAGKSSSRRRRLESTENNGRPGKKQRLV